MAITAGRKTFVNAAGFRSIALGMKDAVEGAHLGHPDFRLDGKIFATIHPDHQFAMVKLTPDQQQEFTRENPASFAPENGAWGRAGCTRVRLDSVDEDTLGAAVTLACQNAVKTAAVQRSKRKRARAK